LLFAVFDAETVAQLTANGIFRGAAYGILGVGFALILGVTGRFHFAYAFTYTLAAYMAYTFVDRVGGLPFWFASMLGVVLVAFVGTGIERFIYRPLANRAGATALLAIFVASLGITIAGENLIRLFWSSSSQNLLGPDQITYSIWEVNFLNFDVWQAVSSFGCVVVLALLLRYTPLGRAIKATRANPELARTIGIDSGQIYLVCFFIGTLLCGLAAFWYGLQFTIDPAMGLKPVIFAFVVAFLAGTAYEWYELIVHHHLTIGTNLFGTTFYTLVGFHAAHVTGGVIVMLVFLGLALRREVTHQNHQGVELVSWYWHFVDGVWVVVFTVVYIVGR